MPSRQHGRTEIMGAHDVDDGVVWCPERRCRGRTGLRRRRGLSAIDLACSVVAIAGVSTVLSHVNDSGFWLVGRFFGMDVKTTLRTWTVMETLIGVVGFARAATVSLVL